MKTSSFIRKSAYSALVFFGTLGILSIGYSAYSSLATVDTGTPLTKDIWNQMVDNLSDLDSRLTGVSGNAESLSGTVSGLSTSLTSLSGAVSSLQVSAGNLWSTVTGGIWYSGWKVGIGTSTPSASLEVKRTAADGNFAAWIEGSSVSNYGLGVNVAGTTSATAIADFKSANTSRLFVRADGNVGIGTVNPQSKLQVWSWSQISDGTDGRAFYGNNAHLNSSNQLVVSNTHAISWGLGMNGWYNSYPVWADASFISKPGNVTAGDIIDPVANTKMTIKSSGNIGIGTATPSQKLEVNGMVYSTSGGFKFPDGTTQATAANTSASVPAGAVMAFYLSSCPSGWKAADGTNSTPDLRGEFIRGLDSGRGVDASRTLGSWQDATGVGMYVYQWVYSQFVNTDSAQSTSTSTSRGGVAGYADNQIYYKVRPRNVALLYCVKN